MTADLAASTRSGPNSGRSAPCVRPKTPGGDQWEHVRIPAPKPVASETRPQASSSCDRHPWRAQTGTHAHAPVPHHAALRPAWWLSGGTARCNAAPVADDGQRLTPSYRTDRYRWESPPAPTPRRPCSRSAVAPSPPTPDVANVGGPSRLSPVRYVTVWSGRGVDERGAAGALPGATAGRRVPGPVPPAGGPKVAATAVERRGTDAPGACRTSTGNGGTRCRHPSPGPRPRRCSIRSAIWTCRYWKLSSRPGASGVTARPPATSFRLAATKRSWAPASGKPSMTAGSCSPVRTQPPGRTAAVRSPLPRACSPVRCCPEPADALRGGALLTGSTRIIVVDLHTPFFRGSDLSVA